MRLSPMFPIPSFPGSTNSPAKYAESLRETEQVKLKAKNDSIEAPADNALVQCVPKGSERLEDVADRPRPDESHVLRFGDLKEKVENLGSEKAIKLYRDSEDRLRGLAYIDKTTIGNKNLRIEEYFGPTGNIQEARYVEEDAEASEDKKDKVIAVTYFPSEISLDTSSKFSLNTSKVKKEPFKPLLENLERAKDAWFDLNDHWWVTPEEKKIKAKLMELIDCTCLIIEQVALGTEEFKGLVVVAEEGKVLTPDEAKKHLEVLAPDEANKYLKVLTPDEAKEYLANKLNALNTELNGTIEKRKKASDSSSSKWNHALNVITGLVSMFAIWCGGAAACAAGAASGVAIRMGGQSTLDRQREIEQNKEFIKGWTKLLVNVLEGEINMSGVSGTPISFNDAFNQIKSDLDKVNKFVDRANPIIDKIENNQNEPPRRHSVPSSASSLEVQQPPRSASVGAESSTISLSREEFDAIIKEAAEKAIATFIRGKDGFNFG